MISNSNKTEELSQDIDYLNALNKLRLEARSLRDKGLEAIVHFSLEDNRNWGQEISDNEKVLFRRAKHLAWNLGKIEEYECDHRDVLYFSDEVGKPQPRSQSYIPIGLYPKWPEIKLPSTHPSKSEAEAIDLFDMRDEPASILFAANYLRTRLGNLHGYLDKSTLLCYYRIIRELYNLHETNWALGGARAGEGSGEPSVFVTTECTRAIGYFARLMENTSVFLKRMAETKAYIEHVKRGFRTGEHGIPALHPSWCESELEWCTASVKTTIESFRDYVALLLPNFAEATDLEKIVACVEKSVRYFVEHSEESFRVVKTRVNQRRGSERKRFEGRRKQLTREMENEQMPEFDLTETAHKIAAGALAGSHLEFRNLREEFEKNIGAAGSYEELAKAANLFAKLGRWLRTHLAPAKEYFEKNLHKCLSEYMRERSPKVVPDLAFSALSVGLITKDWDRHDCRQAMEILCENLDEGGNFPAALPFCYTARGEGRIVINAQVIRAFAQLAQHLTTHLSPEVAEGLPRVVERMVGYFRSHAREHKHGIAWPSLGALNGKRSSLLISSISILSLHRIVLMLDEHINKGVKKHFNTKSPEALRREGVPHLHELMCADIGYVSIHQRHAPGSGRVVMELEGMRAHLLGTGRASKALGAKEALDKLSLRSLILHGPPGTGKTTLVKSLAVTSNVDLVEVMAHDLYRPGTERVMEQASDVMDALSLLTSTVILFDEFEPILHTRPEAPVRITEMLTGNMLPKLDALYKAAKTNGIAYVLATNFPERLEPAAIRAGRFDRKMLIYYPDAVSRICRLVSELRHLTDQLRANDLLPEAPIAGLDLRLLEVAAKTAGCDISRLCQTGWFSAPRAVKTSRPLASTTPDAQKMLSPEVEDKLSPVWKYIIWHQEEAQEIGWTLFRSAEIANNIQGEASAPSSKKSFGQEDIVRQVRDWDERLSGLVRSNNNWQKAIELLSSNRDG